MADALLGFGGNLGDIRTTFDRALAMLCDGKKTWLLARSSEYLTPPWGVENQPPFVNSCVSVETALSPHELLARVQEVERTFGRDRRHETRWGPRTLDIDILAYDDVTLADTDLTVPHPRLFERAFVLVPLNDIAPDRIISGRRVRDALAGIDATGIERLPSRG